LVQRTIRDLAFNENGKITISLLTRTNKKDKEIFYARFLVPQDKKHLNQDGIYKIESLKTKDETDAILKAQVRYGQISSELQQDRILKGRSFGRPPLSGPG
jgi:hypothetical protein